MRDPANAAGGRDNFLTMIQNNGTVLTFTQQLWNAPGTQNRYPNRGSVNIQKNRWYWLEIHARLNTVGQADGFLEIWVDDLLIMQHSDVTFRTTNASWGQYQHSPEWGGGGGTINQEQYIWFDHTVLSTTRIGRPGSTPSGDTTAPRSPTLNFANWVARHTSTNPLKNRIAISRKQKLLSTKRVFPQPTIVCLAPLGVAGRRRVRTHRLPVRHHRTSGSGGFG